MLVGSEQYSQFMNPRPSNNTVQRVDVKETMSNLHYALLQLVYIYIYILLVQLDPYQCTGYTRVNG